MRTAYLKISGMSAVSYVNTRYAATLNFIILLYTTRDIYLRRITRGYTGLTLL